MKISELKPNTLYATCDGGMVKTGDTVENGWFHFTYFDTEKKKEVVAVERQDPRQDSIGKVDPWASCRVGGRQSGGAPGLRLRIHGRGVRVEAFDYDGDGKPLGKGHVRVIAAKDIPGTWTEYMILHADDVAVRWQDRELEKQSREAQAALVATLAKHGIRSGDAFTMLDGYKNNDNNGRTPHTQESVQVRLDKRYVFADGTASSWANGGKRVKNVGLVPTIILTGPTVAALLNVLDGKTVTGRKRTTKKAVKR